MLTRRRNVSLDTNLSVKALKKSIYRQSSSPFAPSGSNCLNFELPVERSPQSQSL
jgi:hypothetical protein